jgi:hypothetical protein
MARLAALVSRIFKFLSANYGHTWAKGIEYSTNESRIAVWSEAVSGLSVDQLQYAKKKILNGECYLDFPPTAAQFRVLCKSMPEKSESVISRFDPDYDIQWFSSLSESDKTKVYESAIRAYPFLENFLKNNNQSFLDNSFEKSVWIKPMIETFREFFKIDSLRWFKIESLGTKE